MIKKTIYFSLFVLFTVNLNISSAQNNTVCSEQIIAGQRVMRCTQGNPPTYHRPVPPQIPINPPPPPQLTPVNPPVINPNPINPIVTVDGVPIPEDISLFSVINGIKYCEFPVGSPGMPGPNKQNPCGAYEIPTHTCSSGMYGLNSIKRAYLLPLEEYNSTGLNIGRSISWGMLRDTAMVFRFKTAKANAFPSLPRPIGILLEEATSRGHSPAHTFISVSEKVCDFDYEKLYIQGSSLEKVNACFASTLIPGIQGKISASGNDPNITFPYCQLKADTTYYINIRFEHAGNPASRGKISCDPEELGSNLNVKNTCGIVFIMI